MVGVRSLFYDIENRRFVHVRATSQLGRQRAEYARRTRSDGPFDKLFAGGGTKAISHFLDPSGSKVMTEEDTRVLVDDDDGDVGSEEAADRYIRGELGYATDLTYAGLQRGYEPFPGPKPASIRDQWSYNQPGVTPDVIAEFKRTGEVGPLAQANPPWIVNALKQNADVRVFVGTARYDPLNMCEGDAIAADQLRADFRRRMTVKCYESGHIIYRDPSARVQLLTDLSDFVDGTMAARATRH